MQPIIREIGGAKLFCIPTDKFKSEYFSLRFALELNEANNHLTTMLLPVLSRGTVTHPNLLSINRYLDELYSTTVSTPNKRMGDMRCIGVSADFLGSRYVDGGSILPQVIDTVAEIVYRPRLDNGCFCPEYVEIEKNTLCDSIRASVNNPRGYASHRCRQMLCEGEPFALSLIDKEAVVRAITPEKLYEHYRFLLENATPIFCYVGSTSADEVAAMITNAFPTFHGRNAPYRAEIKRVMGAPKRAEEAMPFCQGNLAIGLRTDISAVDSEAPALLVLNELFGGSPASKLFLNVREKRSLCYSCSSQAHLFKGLMFVRAGMKPENRSIAEEAILTELDAVKRGEISDIELEAAKRSLDHMCRQVQDNPAAISAFYLGRDMIGKNESPEDFRRSLSVVTASDVVEVAARLDVGATFFLNGTLEGEEDEE
ncbi:MAG: insulinase family protein [Ruminococcaceae bacterium]|nr:insulinase family protein [Oscillospiraceae bacterium]